LYVTELGPLDLSDSWLSLTIQRQLRQGLFGASPNCRGQNSEREQPVTVLSPFVPFDSLTIVEFFLIGFCQLPWEKAWPNSSLQSSNQCYRSATAL